MKTYKDYKVGMRVKRIMGEYKDMVVGDEDIITNIITNSGLTLKKFNTGHEWGNFEIIKAKTLKEFLEDDRY